MRGVERKEMRWPRVARRSARSRKGRRCPKPSHGKMTMCIWEEEEPASMAVAYYALEAFTISVQLVYMTVGAVVI